MSSFTQNYFTNILSKRSFWTSVVCLLIIKAIVAIYLICLHKSNFGGDFYGLMYEHTDFVFFLQPVENYFELGKYTYNGEDAFAGRMPGYWFPYMILRFVFSKYAALNILACSQLLFSAIAGVLLARLSYKLVSRKSAYFFCLGIFATCGFIIPFDYQTLSESFSISAAITAIYFMYKFKESRAPLWHLFIAGFFVAWMIFLRPFLGVSLAVCCLFIYLNYLNIKQSFKPVLIFLVPFLLFETAWVVRNYIAFSQFIPLETEMQISYGKSYSEGWIAIRGLVCAWGEEPASFEPNSMGQWFRSNADARSMEDVLPERIFNNVTAYDMTQVKELKDMYSLFTNSDTETVGSKLDLEIVEKANLYKANYKEQNFIQYLINRCMGVKRLVISSGSSYVPFPSFSKMSLLQKSIKLFQLFLYYYVLLVGLLWLVFAAFKKNNFALLNLGIVISTVLVVAFYSTIQEARYFIVPFVILILYASMATSKFIDRLRSRLAK